MDVVAKNVMLRATKRFTLSSYEIVNKCPFMVSGTELEIPG